MDPRQFFKKPETILFVVSFLVHLAMSIFLYARFGNGVLTFENEDALSYLDVAQNVVQRGGFYADGVVSAYRTPMYPLFLSLFLFLRLPMPLCLLIAQNILASLAGVLLYRLGTMLFSERAGRIAGWVYVLEPYMLMTANLATTETLFNFFLIAFAYLFLKALRGNIAKHYLFSGFLLGVLALTRPVAMYLPCVALIILGVRSWEKKDWRLFASRAALTLVAFVAVLAPWSLRQYAQFGRWRITNIDSFMLYARVAPIVVMDEKQIDYIAAAKMLMERLQAIPGFSESAMIHRFDYYDMLVGATKQMVFSRPLPVLRFYAVSAVPTLFGTGYEYMLEDVLGWERTSSRPSYTETLLTGGIGGLVKIFRNLDIFQAVFFAGVFLWGVVYAIIFWHLARRAPWRNNWIAVLLPLLIALYFVALTLGPASHARYRMPSFPFWYLLLASGIDALLIDFPRFSARIARSKKI